MFAVRDHKTALLGSILTRVDRFEDCDMIWERIDSLTLHRNGTFDWHNQTRIAETGKPSQLNAEHLQGAWHVIGTGNGPHYLQLGTDEGDMFSFAISLDNPDSCRLNKKIWTHQKTGVQVQYA
jgi:hypothetical protein